MKDQKESSAPDDDALFKQAMSGVTRLPQANRAAQPRTKPEPVPLAPRRAGSQPDVRDALSDPAEGAEAVGEYLSNGISQLTLRKLRRGQFPVQDSLDLHGLTSDEARKLLLEFLRVSQQRGLRCVRIIHGKGRHGESGEGILKIRTRHWLMQCPEVLAFCEAPPGHGGGGAVLALLKSNPP